MAGAEREVLPKIPRPPGHQLQAERPEGSPLQESVQRGGERVRGAQARPARVRGLRHEQPPGSDQDCPRRGRTPHPPRAAPDRHPEGGEAADQAAAETVPARAAEPPAAAAV
ncbi:hypothetical protein JYU34_001262 [Plutella xylostella]|uniref:Uncharacterized protein n=1 Tax=Plutella xylostella TaxID=51655 RepID=A0ABQ7R6E7_PLUXY|nr:hypothetical protein JYU34_001262 [Plutella xylostella]